MDAFDYEIDNDKFCYSSMVTCLCTAVGGMLGIGMEEALKSMGCYFAPGDGVAVVLSGATVGAVIGLYTMAYHARAAQSDFMHTSAPYFTV